MNKIIVAICGSMAATAVPAYLLFLKANFNQAEITVILTRNARYFLAKGAIAHLPGVTVVDAEAGHDPDGLRVNHTQLIEGADIFLVLPATANFLGKAANGIADELVTTCFLAYSGPKVIFPAMNADMLASKYVQRNISTLRSFGDSVILGGVASSVATGKVGPGALPDVRAVMEAVGAAGLPVRGVG